MSVILTTLQYEHSEKRGKYIQWRTNGMQKIVGDHSTRPYTFRHPWTISSSSMRHLAIGHCMFDADHREPGILILFNRLPFIPSNILNSDLNIATFKTLKKAIWILMVCNICWTGWKSSNKYRNMYNCRAFRAFFSSQIHVRGCTFQKKRRNKAWTYLRNSSHSQVLQLLRKMASSDE